MRHGPWIAIFTFLAAKPCVAQDVAGISTPVLPGCIAAVTLDAGRANTDMAYGAVALDGVPWVKVADAENRKKSQRAMLRVTGTGSWWTLDGTLVPLRFVCLIDHTGKTIRMQANPQIPAEGNTLPPHVLVVGTVTVASAAEPARDTDLRVQLLDLAASPATAVLAEQVVRTGQGGRMPFALRLAAGPPTAGRRLAINAVVVRQGSSQQRLRQPLPLTEAALAAPIALTID